jgi:hypothetical protein
MRKITVTEENFNKVLEKLQRICNKYKMLEFYRVYTEDMQELKTYRRNSIGFRDTAKECFDEDGNWKYEKVKEFFSVNTYVRVTKHHFREAFEQGLDNYDAKDGYPETKALIHMGLSGCSAEVLTVGDKVQFLPFGGFIVWTDNDFTRLDKPLVIYKHIYFPDFFKGKISNIEEENSIRDAEIEEECDLWNALYERDLLRNMLDDYEYFD